MKRRNSLIILCIIAVLGIGLSSCHDLDLEPKGFLTQEELFSDEGAVQIFFAKYYCHLPIEDFNYRHDRGYKNAGNSGQAWATWEACKFSLQNFSGELVNTWRQVSANNQHEYWPYADIRELNEFIINFPKFEENYPPDVYKSLLGEAHFLRAFKYSGMARRYGGVPIITQIQDPFGDPELLRVSRATEYDTWKFIYEDLKFAVDNMQRSNIDPSRANAYTAAALMSRLMLYAGRIAKYSQSVVYGTHPSFVQRLVTIDPEHAREFFEYAVWAADEVEKGPYLLYDAVPDKAENFAQLFLDPSSTENIFVKQYGNYDVVDWGTHLLGHTWDAGQLPLFDFSTLYGTAATPALDIMLMYDFPDITDADGYPIRWDNREDIKEGMEPRLRGSMYFTGDVHTGTGIEFEIQRGLYRTFDWPASAVVDGLAEDDEPNKEGNRIVSGANIPMDVWHTEEGGERYKVTGRHGIKNGGAGDNVSITGAFVRKFIDPTLGPGQIASHRSHQHWIAIRLAEVYLNKAEAAYELGGAYRDIAFEYIRRIRERAGCKVVDMPDDPTMVDPVLYYGETYPAIDNNLLFIRDERYRELWCENHRWWDLLTWRTAFYFFSNYRPRALACYYVIDEGKYIYLNERNSNNTNWNLNNHNCYYQGISDGQIARNRNLIQNVNRD